MRCKYFDQRDYLELLEDKFQFLCCVTKMYSYSKCFYSRDVQSYKGLFITDVRYIFHLFGDNAVANQIVCFQMIYYLILVYYDTSI